MEDQPNVEGHQAYKAVERDPIAQALHSKQLMDVLKLRVAVDQRLTEMRAEIEQYQHLFPWNGGAGAAPEARASRKGIPVPPKYQGPNGETWAGRGAKPRWLTAAIKKGRKLESFLIK